MAMDYGNNVQKMGQAAIDAAVDVSQQLNLDLNKIAITPYDWC